MASAESQFSHVFRSQQQLISVSCAIKQFAQKTSVNHERSACGAHAVVIVGAERRGVSPNVQGGMVEIREMEIPARFPALSKAVRLDRALTAGAPLLLLLS